MAEADPEVQEQGYAKLIGKRLVERQHNHDGAQQVVVEEDLDILIRSLPARLGRGDGGEKVDGEGCFVSLGNNKSISRVHATISWDFSRARYRIDCLSKNGMVVDKRHYTKGECAYLKSSSAVRLGGSSFYFYLPTGTETDQPSDDDEDDDEQEHAEHTVGGDESDVGEVDMDEEEGSVHQVRPPQPSLQTAARPAVVAGQQVQQGSAPRKTEDKGLTYGEMIFKVFASPELSAKGSGEGLTSAEIAQWILQNFPDWNATPEKRKQLTNGVQGCLTRKFQKRDVPGQRGAKWLVDTRPPSRGQSTKQQSAGTPTTVGAPSAMGSPASALMPKAPAPQSTAPVGDSSLMEDEGGDESDDDAVIMDDDE